MHPMLTVIGTLALASTFTLAANDPYSHLPSTVDLHGTVRDFKARQESGGHPDFQRQPSSGFGHYVGMVADTLSPEGVPVMAGTGYKVSQQWRDAQGRNIAPPRAYIASMPGDLSGARSSSQGGALTTPDNFSKWFVDDPQLNRSGLLGITLVRQPGTNMYVFDDRIDQIYSGNGGFFPINGQLLGNYAETGRNYHFTYALETRFKYQRGAEQTFRFIGDDDVWVFVDDRLVIDLGGVHQRIDQTINLDRLTWLEDGRTYSLKFFFAERHTTESNFRIETTLYLRNVEMPPLPLFD